MFSCLNLKLFPKITLIRSLKKLPESLQKLKQAVDDFITLFQESFDGVCFEVPLKSYRLALDQIDAAITQMYRCFACAKTDILAKYCAADQDNMRKAMYTARETLNACYDRAKKAEDEFFTRNTVARPNEITVTRSELKDFETAKNNFINHIQQFNAACGALNTLPEEKPDLHKRLLSPAISSDEWDEVKKTTRLMHS